jgi:hypothetical protein
MCIAIYKPAGVKIRKTILSHCFDQNPHGAGFAVPDENGITIRKGFFTFREFWREYREKSAGMAMLIHFRVATSGVIDGDNCHPWRIDKDHAMIHNGVLEHKLGLCHDDVSDTGLFAHNILSPALEIAPNIWKTEAFKWVIEQSIGSGNKVVILDNNGDSAIFNSEKGEWFEGSWFSNTTFKDERKKKPGTSVVSQRVQTKNAKLMVPESLEGDIVNALPPEHFYKQAETPETVPADDKKTPTMDVTLYC